MLRPLSLLILIAIVSATMTSCDEAQRDVMASKVMNKIDSALGTYAVAMQRVENGYDAMKASRDKLMEGQIRAEVKAERAKTKVDNAQASVEKIKAAGKKVVAWIDAGEFPVKTGSKTFSKEDLLALGSKLRARLTAAKAHADGMEQTWKTYLSAQKQLGSQYNAAEQQIVELGNQLVILRAKVDALRAQRDAASIAGASGTTIAAQFDNLQNEMDNLFASAETETRLGEAAWKKVASTYAQDSDLLNSLQTSDEQTDDLRDLFD